MKSFYINPSGEIRVIMGMPVKPDSLWFEFKENCDCLICEDYKKALASAKESSILLASEYLTAKELFDCFKSIGVPPEQLHDWLSERKGQTIPFPEGYDVRPVLVTPCNGEGVCRREKICRDGCKERYYIAVIDSKPSPSIEGQEELWSEVEDIADSEISKYKVVPGSQIAFNIMSSLKERFTIARKA